MSLFGMFSRVMFLLIRGCPGVPVHGEFLLFSYPYMEL